MSIAIFKIRLPCVAAKNFSIIDSISNSIAIQTKSITFSGLGRSATSSQRISFAKSSVITVRQFSQGTTNRTTTTTSAVRAARTHVGHNQQHLITTTRRATQSQRGLSLSQRRCGRPPRSTTTTTTTTQHQRNATTVTVARRYQQQTQQSVSLSKQGSVATTFTRKSTAGRVIPISGGNKQHVTYASNMISIRDGLNHALNLPRTLPIPRWISPQRFTFTYSEVCGHASFCLVAISYAVDDFIQLRILAILGSTAMLAFTYFHPHGRVLWLPFKWNCLFIALNTWRVARVYLDIYWSQLVMSDTLVRVYDEHFYILDKADFARLVRLGQTETYHKGDVIVHQDDKNRYVRLVLVGDLNVERDDQITYMLHEGQFISETGLHAGLGLRGAVTSCCSVVAVTDEVQLLRWDRTELMRLLELDVSLERALRAIMSWDIVSKLKSQRELLAGGVITDVDKWTVKRKEQTLSRYKAILQNMLSHPGYLKKRQGRLAKYREIHHVTNEEHIRSLTEMGWTEEEFKLGYKEGQLDDDHLERKRRGILWWFQSWWNAL
jgi:CRP-like cAMP-binding protein